MLVLILKFIAVLYVWIIVHELGHLLMSKYLNVKVNNFCIGAGPTLYSVVLKDTKYTFKLFPFGGHIELSNEKISSKHDMLVSLAGPVLDLTFIGCLFFFDSVSYYIPYLALNSMYNLLPFEGHDGYRVVYHLINGVNK